jgi:type I restriction enzyme S subunit
MRRMKQPAVDLRPGEWEIVRDLLRRHIPEREVWAFGSRVKKSAKPFSDLDLAIQGTQPLELSTLADLTHDFSESDLPFKVDLVDWATTAPHFRAVIEAGHVVLQRPASGQAIHSEETSSPGPSSGKRGSL